MNFTTLENNTFFICKSCDYFRSIIIEKKGYIFCAKCGNKMQCKCRKCGLEFKDPFAKFCERCGGIIKNLNPRFK